MPWQDIINRRCELNLPPALLFAPILEALSYVEKDGQVRKLGWKKMLEDDLIHVQGGHVSTHFRDLILTCAFILVTIAPSGAHLTKRIYLRVLSVQDRLLRCYIAESGSPPLSSFLPVATSLHKPNVPSSTEGTIMSCENKFAQPHSKLVEPLFKILTVSVPG